MSDINSDPEMSVDEYREAAQRYQDSQNDEELKGSRQVYEPATKEENEAKGDLQPIDTDQQAKESVINAIKSPADQYL